MRVFDRSSLIWLFLGSVWSFSVWIYGDRCFSKATRWFLRRIGNRRCWIRLINESEGRPRVRIYGYRLILNKTGSLPLSFSDLGFDLVVLMWSWVDAKLGSLWRLVHQSRVWTDLKGSDLVYTVFLGFIWWFYEMVSKPLWWVCFGKSDMGYCGCRGRVCSVGVNEIVPRWVIVGARVELRRHVICWIYLDTTDQARKVHGSLVVDWFLMCLRYQIDIDLVRVWHSVCRYFWWKLSGFIGLRRGDIPIWDFGGPKGVVWRWLEQSQSWIWASRLMVSQGFALWSNLINNWGRFELRVVRETNGLDYRRISTQARGCDESKWDNGTLTATWLADSYGEGICQSTQFYVHVDYVGFNKAVNYMEKWKSRDNYIYKKTILVRIQGAFNNWFSGDRSGRSLITLPWTIVGGRNFSKRYDVGRLSLDFECMEWSFSGCNKQVYYGWIFGFSWLDVDTIRVKIFRVNCVWVLLKINQGNAGNNSTHHGTVKSFTGGCNPPKPKVDK